MSLWFVRTGCRWKWLHIMFSGCILYWFEHAGSATSVNWSFIYFLYV